ncbi:hypothetical protein CDL12_18909 [Handroanthus impetiginosus]|uniref:Uncharacterized protein n=1 Tax=Handroanthus impetiginosus TaxID=429701 RepID=A0A2G9GT94_9LAMI|nr:hypothetical protein CDL12_18909 [Handroanthus impetiginosus]
MQHTLALIMKRFSMACDHILLLEVKVMGSIRISQYNYSERFWHSSSQKDSKLLLILIAVNLTTISVQT